jgi:tRNA threonylcarbamoyladenosine biosynthesis protein TsaB
MSLLLNIDTATEHASVCLSNNSTILGMIESSEQKNHASFIQPAIQELMAQTGHLLKDLDAVSVTAGPGSYTGLRVGLSSAKGICFALDKPLILVNTLEVMAQSIISHLQTAETAPDSSTLLCPMIDARRMEVFTALYTLSLEEIEAPYALIIDENAFTDVKYQGNIIFSGSGYPKLQGVINHPKASFLHIQHNASHLAIRASISCESGRFASLAYAEPLYVKAFFDTSKKPG